MKVGVLLARSQPPAGGLSEDLFLAVPDILNIFPI